MTDLRQSAPPHEPPDWEALARFEAGESPEAEARAVAAWLAAHPRDAAVLAGLDDALARATDPFGLGAVLDAPVDVEAALRRVKARREVEVAMPPAAREAAVLPMRPRHAAPARGSRAAWWTGAGLVAAAAVVTVLVLRERGAPGVPGEVTPGGAPALAAGAAMATPVGVRDSVRLPDGSRVLLAPGSRLAVAAAYGDGAREVTLEGMAHFTVTHDEARPFTVRAGAALVRDLGTVFTVRTDGVDSARGVGVVVTEGRVSLVGQAARDTGVVLDAGDRGTLSAGGVASAERDVVADADVAWTGGTLSYRAAPLAMVAADLRRWYGVELRVADPAIAARRLTASFTDEPVEQVLQVVALAIGAEVVRDGMVATLRAARPARTGGAVR